MNKFLHKDFENTGEFILPDYLGDVKKVLYSSAKAIPSGKFVSDGEMHLSGIVCYDVLYCDSENKLTRYETTSDYDVSVAVDSLQYVDSLAETRVASFAIRPTGPRKFSAKSSLALSVNVSRTDSFACTGNAFEEGRAPEKLTEKIKCESCVFGTSGEREYAELAEHVIATSSENIEVITSSGAVRITESTPVDGGVAVKGEIIITAIIKTDEQPPFAIKKNIPFEETVTIENMPAEAQTIADGYLTSVNAFVTDDEEGHAITVNAIAEFYAVSAYNSEAEIMCDAYLEDYETDGRYSDMEYNRLVYMGTDDGSFTLECERKDIDAENIRDILFMSFDIRKTEKKVCKDGVEITGEAVFSGVACEINDDSTLSYVPLKFNMPFVYNVNNSCQITDKTGVECILTPVYVECILDAERLSLRCGVKSNVRIYESNRITRMTECFVTGETNKSRQGSLITVYYPEAGETLFEVAKKYRTTGAKIAQDNSIADSVISDGNSSLSGISKLIIR